MISALVPRLIGVAIIGVGVAFAWFFGIRPLDAAAAGAPQIQFQMKLFIAAPLAIVCGLFLLIGGAPVGEAISGPPVGKRQHLIVWTMFLLAMAAGALAYVWFDARLEALGYSV